MNELKPCESVVYLHYLIGGPRDGDIVPSAHRYETYESMSEIYYDTGDEAEPVESNWEALNCTKEYREFVYLKVTMKNERQKSQT